MHDHCGRIVFICFIGLKGVDSPDAIEVLAGRAGRHRVSVNGNRVEGWLFSRLEAFHSNTIPLNHMFLTDIV